MSVKKFCRELALKAGYALSKGTCPADLAAFLESMRPVDIEEGLVRVGGAGDGGYLLPDNLSGIAACYSPGVADSSDFELMLAERYGITCHLADHSVAGPAVDSPHFTFTRKFLGDRNDDVFMRLEDWVAGNADRDGAADLLLQMDIEGAEYPVLLDTPAETLRRFRIIAIEFHSLDLLFNRGAFPLLKAAFDKLLRDFAVVHNHPNNCAPAFRRGDVEIPPLLEITFYRRDCLRPTGKELTFPHPLDETNVPSRPDIVLPPCWR